MITKEKRREYMRRYREKHPEKVREATKKYDAAQRLKRAEYSKNYYHTKVKNNPEALAKRAAYHAKWQKENIEKVYAYRKKKEHK